MDEAQRLKAQRDSVEAAQTLVDTWPLVLDGLDGIVKQTIERGFTPDQARAIVTGLFARTQTPSS